MELLAVIAALYSWVELFRGKLVIIWVDNQSVCSAIVSGASIAEDIHAFIAGLHWHCALNHIGLWAEWIPSESNPVDEPSRLGTSAYASTVETLEIPEWCEKWHEIVPSLLKSP